MPHPPTDRLASARRDLVRAGTRLRRPEAVPEVRLHLTDDLVGLWKETGEEAPPPFWAVAWLGGQALARYLLDHPAEVRDRRVLDLGSGSGLVAIAARLAGASAVLAADIDPVSLAAIELNAAANGVRIDRTGQDLLGGDPPEVDVVLAGDVWYEREMASRVQAWLGRSRARVLLGDPGRTYLPPDGWQQLAEYDIPTTRELEGVESRRVRVFCPAA